MNQNTGDLKARGTFLVLHQGIRGIIPGPTSGNSHQGIRAALIFSLVFSLLFLKAFRSKFIPPPPSHHEWPTLEYSGCMNSEPGNAGLPRHGTDHVLKSANSHSEIPSYSWSWNKCSAKGHRASRDALLHQTLCLYPSAQLLSGSSLLLSLRLTSSCLWLFSALFLEQSWPIPHGFHVQLKGEITPKTSGFYTVNQDNLFCLPSCVVYFPVHKIFTRLV